MKPQGPALLLLVAVLSGCSTVEGLIGQGDSGSAIPDVDAEAVVANPVLYRVTIEGTEPGGLPDDLQDQLEASSNLVRLKDQPPATRAALGRRIQDDRDRLQGVLQSQGYYNGTITPDIKADQDPVVVDLKVDPGPTFLLSDYRITYRPADPDADLPHQAEDLGLELGQVAKAEGLIAAEAQVLQELGQDGYPYARVSQRRYLANRELAALSAELVVDTGPKSQFGQLDIKGLDRVEPGYLNRVVDWKPGETYDTRKLEALRRQLVGTGLFDSVVVSGAKADNAPPARSGATTVDVPVEVTVAERLPRSIGAGVAYSTDQGFSANAFWENRNLFGEAEKLRLEATAGLQQQTLNATFRKPNYLKRRQALLASLDAIHKNTDAYKETSVTPFAGLERTYGDSWTVVAGPTLQFSEVEGANEATQRYVLAGFRGNVTYDNRDDLLNPTQGVRSVLSVTPYTSIAATETQFAISSLEGSTYYKPLESDRVVLAVRGKVGSILGKSRSSVPANLRFYSGGGGSVRGYAYQSLGPLDSDNNPTGGRSVTELNLETRFKVTDTIGIVPFVDGGEVYNSVYPEIDTPLRWAVGIGLRYYTAIGPLRADFARPLDRRQSDDPFQFYLSLGQAF